MCHLYNSIIIEMKERTEMTFAKLLSSLKPLDANAALIFEVEDHVIGAGYHVTELRHSVSTGIDCGGNIEAWQEARLQLLDGPGKAHMSVGKFTDILEKSLGKLPKLSGVPLLVEFSPGNFGLKLMALSEPSVRDGRVFLKLRESKAICKPAQRNKLLDEATNACCRVSNSVGACCGSEAGEACCA